MSSDPGTADPGPVDPSPPKAQAAGMDADIRGYLDGHFAQIDRRFEEVDARFA